MILSMITPVLGNLTATYSDETIILDYASKLSKFSLTPKFSFCIHPLNLLWFRHAEQTTGTVLNRREQKKQSARPNLLESVLRNPDVNKCDLLRVDSALIPSKQKLKSVHPSVHFACNLRIRALYQTPDETQITLFIRHVCLGVDTCLMLCYIFNE